MGGQYYNGCSIGSDDMEDRYALMNVILNL